MRKIKLETEKYYHVFNRGANKQEIFLDEKDYLRFLRKMREMNNNLRYNQRQYLKNKEKEAGQKPGFKALKPGFFLVYRQK